eukprot:3848904-Alexandrium_andersonii.AAC.1
MCIRDSPVGALAAHAIALAALALPSGVEGRGDGDAQLVLGALGEVLLLALEHDGEVLVGGV